MREFPCVARCGCYRVAPLFSPHSFCPCCSGGYGHQYPENEAYAFIEKYLGKKFPRKKDGKIDKGANIFQHNEVRCPV